MMTLQPRHSLFIAIILCSAQPLLRHQSALAQTSGEVSGDSRRWRVQVEVVSDGVLEQFEAVLREWFEINAIVADIHHDKRLDPHDVLSDVPDKELLRVWVTFPRRGEATIYFVEPGSQRFLVRDVPLGAEFDEVAREQLVQVIVTSAEAFMQRRAGTSKEDFTRALRSLPPEPAASPQAGTGPFAPLPTRAAAFRTALRLGASYQLAIESERAIAQGPGVVLGLLHDRGSYEITFDLTGQYSLPHTVHAGDIDLRLRGLALRGFVGIEHHFTETLASGLRVGGGGDRMSLEPLSVFGSGVEAQAAASHWRPAMALDWKGMVEAGATHLALLVGGAAYLKRTQYLVVLGGTPHVAYAPFLVEPRVVVELTWN